jgi:hypothetical protein
MPPVSVSTQSEGDKEKRTSVLKIDRFKDHESCGQFGFTLELQEVEEHPGEFSLVPRLDGTVRPKSRGPAPKQNALLLKVIANSGKKFSHPGSGASN